MKELQFYNKRFEETVRDTLQIYDRPLTEEDVLPVRDLDCSQFTFYIDDCDTLCAFKNLAWLDINIGFEDLSFLSNLQSVKVLSIEFYRDSFDCTYLTPLQKLEDVFISGGVTSDFEFRNFEEIKKLSNLKSLGLHEFGTVDLSVLKEMLYLKELMCGYGNRVHNIDAISNLVNLESLRLIDVTMPNMDFLRALPRNMALELCGVNILENVDLTELERFADRDISEIEVKGERVL